MAIVHRALGRRGADAHAGAVRDAPQDRARQAEERTPIGLLRRVQPRASSRVEERYAAFLTRIVARRLVTVRVLVGFGVGIVLLNVDPPAGFVPNEDQGIFYAIIQTPARHDARAHQRGRRRAFRRVGKDIEGVESISSLAGYKILTEGRGSNAGTCLINLKPWDERKHSVDGDHRGARGAHARHRRGMIEFFEPPSVPGYGAAGGFELRLLDKTGTGDYRQLERGRSKQFMA